MSDVLLRLPAYHVYRRTRSKERARDGVPVCSLWHLTAPCIAESGSTFRVYLGNLSFNVDDEVLKKHFASCGPIERIDYITDKTTGKFYGTAFAEFGSEEAAQNAVLLNGQKLLGRPMKVELAQQKKPAAARGAPSRTLFIGRIPQDADENEIGAMAQKYGAVQAIRWSSKPDLAGLYTAFVDFADVATCTKALEGLRNSMVTLKGKKLIFDFGKEHTPLVAPSAHAAQSSSETSPQDSGSQHPQQQVQDEQNASKKQKLSAESEKDSAAKEDAVSKDESSKDGDEKDDSSSDSESGESSEDSEDSSKKGDESASESSDESGDNDKNEGKQDSESESESDE